MLHQVQVIQIGVCVIVSICSNNQLLGFIFDAEQQIIVSKQDNDILTILLLFFGGRILYKRVFAMAVVPVMSV